VLLRVCERVVLPPVCVSSEEARPLFADSIPDRPDDLRSLVESVELHAPRRSRVVAEACVLPVDLDLVLHRGDPVSEPLVDTALRCPEHRHRLTPVAEVLELAAHHAREHALPPVAREDADHGHARGGDLGTRHCERERVIACGSHHRVAVRHVDRALGRDEVLEAIDEVGRGRVAERRLGGLEELPQVVCRAPT
jgi:hypothetical protein